MEKQKEFTKIKDAIANHNSTENQRIKGKFVSMHVHANVGGMVEFILKSEHQFHHDDIPFVFDDITNAQYYEIDGDQFSYQELNDHIESLKEKAETLEDKLLETEDQKENIENGLEDLKNQNLETWLEEDGYHKDKSKAENLEAIFGKLDKLEPLETLIELTQGKLAQAEKAIEDLEQAIEETMQDIDLARDAEDDPKYSEIYEWYIVSSFLCEKLEAIGECTIDHENLWGRCTTGQAILLDYCIGRICAEMEILDGQQYAWNE